MLTRHGRPHPASSVLLSFEKGNRRGDKQHAQQGRTQADSCTVSNVHMSLRPWSTWQGFTMLGGQDHFSGLCLASWVAPSGTCHELPLILQYSYSHQSPQYRADWWLFCSLVTSAGFSWVKVRSTPISYLSSWYKEEGREVKSPGISESREKATVPAINATSLSPETAIWMTAKQYSFGGASLGRQCFIKD